MGLRLGYNGCSANPLQPKVSTGSGAWRQRMSRKSRWKVRRMRRTRETDGVAPDHC